MTASLGGCSSFGTTPLAESLRQVIPSWGRQHIPQQAAALPYASLSVDINGNRGLIVLATQAGEMTYWQAQDAVTLALAHGGLASTGGLKNDVISSRYVMVDSQAVPSALPAAPWLSESPTRYRLERSWQGSQELTLHSNAEGTMQCEPAKPIELPLQTRMLERCELTQHWGSGKTTVDKVWRDPSDHRLWAAAMVPWPGQRALEWQVAKPWWPIPADQTENNQNTTP